MKKSTKLTSHRNQMKPRYCPRCRKWYATSANGISEHSVLCIIDPISAAFAIEAGRL